MTKQAFRTKIMEKFHDASIKFHYVDGRHLAVFPDEDMTISGTTRSNRITVTWGSGHCAMSTL